MKNRFFLSIMAVILATLIPQTLKSEVIETHVTSFGSYDFSGKHFCILSNMENISYDDIEFKEYAKYISYVLQMRGGIEVSYHSDSAEICVLLSYDIKDASYTRTVSEPVWGKTNLSSVTTTTNMSGEIVHKYRYNYGVVDYKQSQQRVNSFNRYVDLFVYELSPNRKDNQKMVWKAYAKSEGSGDNLFKVFPYMALTFYETVGNANEDYWCRFREDDFFISAFKEGELTPSYITFFPDVDNGWEQTSYEKGKDDYSLWCVIKRDDRTVVILKLGWGSDDNDAETMYMLYENTYISCEGEKYKCTRGENIDNDKDIKLGKSNMAYSSNQSVYIALYFPPLPKEAHVINIVSQKKKEESKADLIWKRVRLRNW